MTWLTAPSRELAAHLLTVIPELGPLTPAASEEDVVAVRPGENGEPLVVLPPELGHRHCYRELGLTSLPPEMMLRRDVVHRLLVAQRELPEGFSVVVLDGWRTPDFQRDLLAYYREQTGDDLDGYVADPSSTTRMAPHTTGGAVDLTLAYDGEPLPMGTDFDSFDDAAHLLALESVPTDAPVEARAAARLRRLLGHVLGGSGFAPYPLEWWHWSYGEQRWAAFVGRPETLYSPVTTP